uniref:Uncharacterized protein n=1 Tax=Anopheles atroparvus TaxID=41427 RepID=A0A182IXM9_ANOAO
MKFVQLLWWTLFLLSHQLCENGGAVESKVRNRVQKWQQRTWRARFGSALRKDWRSAFGPPKSHRRTRYGLSPEEEDFFTSDSVPNAYSNYHYRRFGASHPRARGAGGPTKDRDDGIPLSESRRPKRHARGRSELTDDLKDYLDPVDLMMLDDDPNGELFPLAQTELGQQYRAVDDEAERISFPFVPESSESDKSVLRTGIGAWFLVTGGEVLSLRIAPVTSGSSGTMPTNTSGATTGGHLLGKPPNVPEVDPLRWLVSKSGSFFKG